jgi:hypothetical protein
MNCIIFLYRTKGIEPRLIAKMNTQLFGKEQQSNYGRYKYEIKGIIPEGGFIRPIKAVVIVKDEYSEDIGNVFDSYGIQYRSFNIELKENDINNHDFF